ncbi:MAG: LysR family transcriptional regulator [Balneolaceae bacterium]
MTIQQIEYFLILSNELHFWKTAEKVSISQSSLSRQIQSLEDELGFKLFERDKRNVKLTDAGKFLQVQWDSIISELDQIQRQAKKIDEGASGTVSISYPGSIAFSFLPEILRVLNSNLPDLKIELIEPTDENHEKLLLNYKIDIAFSRDGIPHSKIESLKLYSEPICLVVPNNHWLNKDSLNNLNELEEEKFIISGLQRKTFYATLLRGLFNHHGFEPKTIIESDFGGMILNLVSKEIGISILPYSFKFANTENVRFIELDEQIDLFINWRKSELNKAVGRIVGYAEQLGKEYD